MSYENAKLMNLEDGQLLLSVLDKRKADIISVSDITAEAVKTFSDGADGMPMGLTVGIEPVQDLHGQENPYPAGGGINIINDGTDSDNGYVNNKYLKEDGAAVTDNDWYISEYIEINPQNSYMWSSQDDINSPSVCYYDSSKAFISGEKANRTLPRVLTIPQNAAYIRASQNKTTMKCQIELGTIAHEWSPYSNICPISGWDKCKITRTGKNLLNIHGEYIIRSAVPTTVETQENSVSVTSTYSGAAYCGFIVPVEVGMTYTFSYSSNNSEQKARIAQLDAPISAIVSEYGDEMVSGASVTATKPYFLINFVDSAGTAEPTIYTNPMIEIGSTATAYEAHQGDTYQIAFPSEAGTVYGGTLTVNEDKTGTLVVDHLSLTLDGVLDGDVFLTSSYVYPGTQTVEEKSFCLRVGENYRHAVGVGLNEKYTDAFASYLPAETFNNINARIKMGYSPQGNWYEAFIFYVPGCKSKQDYLDYFASNPIQFTFPMLNPVTYTLSDLEVIETLKGNNVIFADTGDIKAVEYPADTKLYIDKKIAELQAMILENISNS